MERWLSELACLVNTAGTMVAAARLVWPAKPTPPSYGWREGVEALVVGNLYDGATPMLGSKWMRNGTSDRLQPQALPDLGCSRLTSAARSQLAAWLMPPCCRRVAAAGGCCLGPNRRRN